MLPEFPVLGWMNAAETPLGSVLVASVTLPAKPLRVRLTVTLCALPPSFYGLNEVRDGLREMRAQDLFERDSGRYAYLLETAVLPAGFACINEPVAVPTKL
jgi:hypothetical protein